MLKTAAPSVVVATIAKAAGTYYCEGVTDYEHCADSGALHKKCQPSGKFEGPPSQNGSRFWCYSAGAVSTERGQKAHKRNQGSDCTPSYAKPIFCEVVLCRNQAGPRPEPSSKVPPLLYRLHIFTVLSNWNQADPRPEPRLRLQPLLCETQISDNALIMEPS